MPVGVYKLWLEQRDEKKPNISAAANECFLVT